LFVKQNRIETVDWRNAFEIGTVEKAQSRVKDFPLNAECREQSQYPAQPRLVNRENAVARSASLTSLFLPVESRHDGIQAPACAFCADLGLGRIFN